MTRAGLLSRRNLRLTTGLVLFTYILLHLLNHALGLFSVAAAEGGLRIALAVWQSLPGTLLLYGSAIVHVALALESLFARRTLRMAPLDAVRVLLGLGIPTLLIGHAVATRLAWQLYAESPHYAHVVWSLRASGAQGLQLALLVPGWLHGCIGVHLAFARRRWYQRLHRLFYSVMLLLPVLGALGYISMDKELAADAANRAQLDASLASTPRIDDTLSSVAQALLAAYVAAIAAVFIARIVRGLIERRFGSLVRIDYPGRAVSVPRGWSVLEASRSHGLSHQSMCGGRARCSTCRVRVTRGAAHCPPPGPAERVTLARIGADPQVRLACQLRPAGDIAVTPLLRTAPRSLLAGQPRQAPALEQVLAGLLVAWVDRDALLHSLLPQDAVFLSMRFNDCIANTLEAAGGGLECNAEARGLVAVFGVGAALPAACRSALAAAEALDRELKALAAGWQGEFGVTPRFVIALHAGPVAIGEAGHARGRTAAGPLVDALARLARLASDGGFAIALSQRLQQPSGIDFASTAGIEPLPADGLPWWPLADFSRAAKVADTSTPEETHP